MERHPVADLDAAEAAQERGELVYAAVELTVGDRLGVVGLGLGYPDQRRLVRVSGEVTVDAVVRGVEAAPDDLPSGL
jgi:hypothetical protein